jgi:flavodoxin/ferredoxin
MPKSLIVHFSQGGSTTKIAQSIGAGLRGSGHEVTVCDIREHEPSNLEGYDLFGIGSPTYYFRLPFNVASYVEQLPPLAGLPVFAFVLHATYRGDAGNALRQGLAAKGARLVGYFHSQGAGTFYPYFGQGYQFSPGHPTAGELDRAEAFGRELAARIEGQAAVRLPEDPPLAAIYRFERFLVNRWLARHFYSRLFRVDRGKCSACGLCMRECPVDNISADAQGQPVWGRECILCWYCEMKCPEEAIRSPISSPIFLPFMVYNVRAGAHDESLGHRRATIDHGRLKELS